MRGNQITLRLNRGFTARAGSLFQYDRGQRLLLTGVELPEHYQVHFSNEELGVSKPVIGDRTGADIPDEYLVSGQPIHVWVYVSGEDHAETEYHGIIGVTRRALPTDAAPAPAQRSLIDQTLGALAAAVEHTEEIRHRVEEISEGMEDSSPPLDASLTLSTAAAPADQVGALKSALNELADPAKQGDRFLKANNLNSVLSDKVNVLQTPYAVSDITDNSIILSNGSIRTGDSTKHLMVTPLIPVSSGTYGLKVIKGNYDVGNIVTASDNAFGLYASDGETVVTKPSKMVSLGNDIYLFEVPSTAKFIRFSINKNVESYTENALGYFNQWIFLPNAGSTITEDFFILAEKKADGTIDKLLRADGSQVTLVDQTARQEVENIKEQIGTVSNAVEFVKINDFDGNDGVKSNVIESPYTVSDMLDSSMILSNGTIATGASYATSMVSPLIPVNSGMYGLKVVHDTDYPALGNIHGGNNYNNGFSFFAEDGETVVSRASRAQVLGNDIYVIEVPSNAKYIRFTILKNSSGSSYTERALGYFNQWIFLLNADSTITDDFFDLGTPKENGEIEKILRKDGSYLEIKDKQARDAIAGMDVGEVSSFLDSIDIESSFTNLLNLPYAESDILKFSNILSSGRVRNERSEYDRTTSLTPLIPVVAGKYALYVPSGQGTTSKGQLSSVNNGYGLFSSDGETPVAKTDFTSIGNGIFSIDIPEGASYIRLVFFHGPANTGVFSDESVRQGLFYLNKNWVLIKTDETSLTPADFTKRQNGSLQTIKRADGSRLMISPTTLPDQKILVFGDSIWGNDRLNGLADYLAEYSGAAIYNCAIGGTRITGDRSTHDGGDSWRPFDGANLIHAKLENTWTEQDAHATEVASYVAGETLPLLKSVDMSSVNIVILAYGHNDFTGNKTISAIVAAYEQVITEILTAYPLIRILVCTSPWRSFSGEDADIHQNDNGDTLRAMDDAIITMAKSKHVAVLDTLSEVPWNGLTKGVYLDDDETHPSTLGNMVYAHVVNGKLRSMF